MSIESERRQSDSMVKGRDFPEIEPDDEFVPYLPGRLRRSAVIETFAFLSAALLASSMFGDGTRFLDMALHPFWIIVLLITVQYGQREAVFAAVAATAFLLIRNLPDQKLTETTYDYSYRILFQPLLWLVAALVLGGVRSRQIRERQELVYRLRKSSEAANASLAKYALLKRAKENLELRLAQERRSMSTVFDMARALHRVDRQTLMVCVERLVRTALAPQKFSLFRMENGALVLAQAFGWTKNDAFPDRYERDAPLARHLQEVGEALSVVNAEDEGILRGQGMLARILREPETGRVWGMLKIEEMEFHAFTASAHDTFAIVCDWIAMACGQAGCDLRPIAAREALRVIAEQGP